MPSKTKSPKKENGKDTPRIDILAAALYWVIRLAILLWDRFVG